MREEYCTGCKHLDKKVLRCKRYPPPWRKVKLDDWCGEHEPTKDRAK